MRSKDGFQMYLFVFRICCQIESTLIVLADFIIHPFDEQFCRTMGNGAYIIGPANVDTDCFVGKLTTAGVDLFTDSWVGLEIAEECVDGLWIKIDTTCKINVFSFLGP